MTNSPLAITCIFFTIIVFVYPFIWLIRQYLPSSYNYNIPPVIPSLPQLVVSYDVSGKRRTIYDKIIFEYVTINLNKNLCTLNEILKPEYDRWLSQWQTLFSSIETSKDKCYLINNKAISHTQYINEQFYNQLDALNDDYPIIKFEFNRYYSGYYAKDITEEETLSINQIKYLFDLC